MVDIWSKLTQKLVTIQISCKVSQICFHSLFSDYIWEPIKSCWFCLRSAFKNYWKTPHWYIPKPSRVCSSVRKIKTKQPDRRDFHSIKTDFIEQYFPRKPSNRNSRDLIQQYFPIWVLLVGYKICKRQRHVCIKQTDHSCALL